jgi:lysylphosphatidylglycerol synthetase-like protein (DUF2156 family)
MSSRPFFVSVSWFFILLNAMVWLGLGVIIAANAHPALPDLPLLKKVLAGLSFFGAGCFLVAFFFLLKRKRFAYYLALVLLAGTALLTFFDQVGWTDLVILAVNIVPIILLIKDREWYLHRKARIVGGKA